MEDKKKWLLKYITVEQARKNKDKRDYIKPKNKTIEAETERAAQYALWTGPNGPDIDHIVSVTEITKDSDHSPASQYKVGWYDKNEKRQYRIVDSKEEALDLIKGLMDYPGQISVKQVMTFELR